MLCFSCMEDASYQRCKATTVLVNETRNRSKETAPDPKHRGTECACSEAVQVRALAKPPNSGRGAGRTGEQWQDDGQAVIL